MKKDEENNINVEIGVGPESNSLDFSADVGANLLSMASVHPIPEEGVNKFIKRSKVDKDIIKNLLAEDKLREVIYENKKFYVRRLSVF